MRRNIKIIISLLATLFIFYGCSERFSTYYQTYDGAVKKGAIQSGWIPTLVPKTATEIYEQHDLDTNEVWVRFNLSTAEKDKVANGLRKLTHEEILMIKLRYPAKVNWWFEGLIQQSPSNDNALNSDIYTIKQKDGKSAYLAIDRISSRVYYWNTYEKG